MKKLMIATFLAATLPAAFAFADTQLSRAVDDGLSHVESGVGAVFVGIGDFYEVLERGLEHRSLIEGAFI